MLGGIFEKNDIKSKIQTFNKKINDSNFWKNKLFAQNILKEKKFLEAILDNFNSTVNELKNLFNLDDPKKMFSKWENKYKKLYRHKLTSTKDLDYFVLMVKQKYDIK